MDHESPEVIEQEMEGTRKSLTDKVAALESQVMGTLQNAQDAMSNIVDTVKSVVPETLTNVKDTITESVHDATDSIKSTFDISHHTRENPWMMVGGAAAAGFVTGLIAFGRSSHGWPSGMPAYNSPASVPQNRPSPAPQYAAPMGSAPPAAAPRKPSWLDQLMERAGEEAKKLGEMALAKATASLKQAVEEELPKLLNADNIKSTLLGNHGGSGQQAGHTPGGYPAGGAGGRNRFDA